ncbi:MAG: phospho-sugar mutase [Acidimicrobiia bacterium]|nr:MAG: phospho-sugar mutase [Acidimicrobiia bacterium]
MTDIETRTLAWIDADPDPATRSELLTLLRTGAVEELSDRMNGSLEFGTAGLRGVVEAGSNRMNRATVIRATAGLATFLLSTTDPNERLVAIGRDARLSSRSFMDDAIGVLAAAGFRVRYFEDPTPTPLVAFAGLSMGACASIVITASHNPPADNGYKVYASNGVQIVPPTDADIAERIVAVGAANEVPRSADPYSDSEVRAIGRELFEEYLRSVAASLSEASGDRRISIVYTAMHGVGGKFVTEALRRFGFKQIHPVARQFAPDGTFPTVSFPNPEEPGALDLAHELAQSLDADIVLASDPDTDRLAVSVPVPGGVWRPLTGNQIGCLLADHLLGHTRDVHGTVINSIVSTPMLGDIATAHGATWHQSLTGFKWIWNAALDLEQQNRGSLVLGFEEALGYSVGTTVRDKDGISAAVAFAFLAADAASEGAIVLDRLGDLYRRYGIWVSAQASIRREGPSADDEIASAMAQLRAEPPASIADIAVKTVKDFSIGADERPSYLGATNLIELDLGATGRVLARPSGTEPKLKIYVDLTTPFPDDGAWLNVEDSLLASATRVGTALTAWLETSM